MILSRKIEFNVYHLKDTFYVVEMKVDGEVIDRTKVDVLVMGIRDVIQDQLDSYLENLDFELDKEVILKTPDGKPTTIDLYLEEVSLLGVEKKS